MTYLRMLWELLTGRLSARIAQLEADRASFAAHYNQHVAFTRSKLQSLTNFGNGTRVMVLRLASTIESAPEPHVEVVEAFSDADDERTIALTDEDIVMPKPRRR